MPIPFARLPDPEGPPQQRYRRMNLVQADFERFGWTPGCPACTHPRRGGDSRKRHPHSEVCRERIEKAILSTPEGQARKDRETARREEELDRHIEQEDAKIRAREEATNATTVGAQEETAHQPNTSEGFVNDPSQAQQGLT